MQTLQRRCLFLVLEERGTQNFTNQSFIENKHMFRTAHPFNSIRYLTVAGNTNYDMIDEKYSNQEPSMRKGVGGCSVKKEYILTVK